MTAADDVHARWLPPRPAANAPLFRRGILSACWVGIAVRRRLLAPRAHRGRAVTHPGDGHPAALRARRLEPGRRSPRRLWVPEEDRRKGWEADCAPSPNDVYHQETRYRFMIDTLSKFQMVLRSHFPDNSLVVTFT